MEGTAYQQVTQTKVDRQLMVDRHRLRTALAARKVIKASAKSSDVTVKTIKIKFVTKVRLLRAGMNGKLSFRAFIII